MELEFGGKKKERKEGKYKLRRLVNIIMCASCNHPFKCRYQRGVLTDGCPRGQRRHEETELDGNWSKVTTLPRQSWSFRSRRCCGFSVVFVCRHDEDLSLGGTNVLAM